MSFRYILIFISFIYTIVLTAQKKPLPSDLGSLNQKLLSDLYNKKLNEHRKSLSLSQLKSDPVLIKAALIHSEYMSEKDTLTHNEITPERKTPFDRVKYLKGKHDGVGENCLYFPLFTYFKSKKKKDSTKVSTYEDAAEQLFIQWKNSPGHYKNMIEPKYDLQGISFSYNKEKNKFYATQVFGMVPYNYPSHLEQYLNDYNIKPKAPAVCKPIVDENLPGYRVANRIFIEDNKIYIYLQYPKPFEKVFTSQNDMIAIDVVFKDQFNCEKNNRLNGSPYYDGVLLPPVSFKELFKRNTLKEEGRLKAFLCDLPQEVRIKNYQLNTVLIKNSCFCDYSFPVEVASQNYDLINLQPFWDTVNVALRTDTFHRIIKQRIRFDKGKSTFNKFDLLFTQVKLAQLKDYMKSMTLNAYSSVEGDPEINKSIQTKRAANVLAELQPFIKPGLKIKTLASENWDMFNSLIPNTSYDFLLKEDKKTVKQFLKDSTDFFLELILDLERYVEFEIEVEGTYNNFSDPNILEVAIHRALANKNYKLAHEIQSKIIYSYLKEKASIDNLSYFDMHKDTLDLPFYINLLAAKSINEYSPYFQDIKGIRQLYKKYSYSQKAQYNFCIYAIKYWSFFKEPFMSPDSLFQQVEKCYQLAPDFAVNSMLLNYHLTAVAYYDHKNNYKKMVAELDKIHALFISKKLSENTSYKLALYFCNYNATDWAVELLEPFGLQTKNKDVLMLYLQAGVVHYRDGYPDEFVKILDRYIQLYPKDFKNWVIKEYQLLRIDFFKERFCRSS
jgi:uncharacterized protein YkwD